jgi:hypothetical protein
VDPARLARTWHRRLPGAAMLALERAATDLPALGAHDPGAAGADDGGEPADPLERGLRRRGEAARAALREVKRALGEADAGGAARGLTTARAIAAPLGDQRLLAWIALFESELALATGDVVDAVERSCLAEDVALRAQDAPTYLAVWWIRAVRALRRGDGGVGELMTQWMERWLAQVSPRARLRLQCFAAAFALDDERPGRAIDVAASVVSDGPGTAEAALAGSLVTQAFLALNRPTDAARVATSSIDRCAGLPPRIAGRLYLDAATALDAAGATEHAARASQLAFQLDPDVASAATAADFARTGIEIRVL